MQLVRAGQEGTRKLSCPKARVGDEEQAQEGNEGVDEAERRGPISSEASRRIYS